MSIKNLLTFLFFSVFSITSLAQTDIPFGVEIRAFRAKDSAQMPSKGQILFVGSSSFTNWTDVQDYFPEYPIINRGFGGSSLPDVIRYADDVIFKYDPSQIVIYCGENDLAGSNTETADTVFNRFKVLFGMIRAKYPKVPVVFVSLKPSPSRAHLMPEMLKANVAIRNFLKKKKKTDFVDVYHAMLTSEGKPMPDIFLKDELHMNAKGYAIWQEKIKPYLKKPAK
ncbi:MAG: GDSL-type esterase/lipase family protein [Chitinophagaceae bacterium]|nr:GDSL-type esterase/lipase family protein [Chitinophagaceae bacterium]